tara:strand:- start:1791 stop:2888 length:1098 start_codon:yes stop_codon:yes gene_type:complete
MKVGILGLPNVGKSTIFNALTASDIPANNYPFCTIEPNVGIVSVPDIRLDQINSLMPTEKIIPAIIEFVDIAGLVKGASSGEGLGNKFLSHVRNVDALIHVVRCFENDDITHVEGSLDPIRDIQIIETELLLKDIEKLNNRLLKINKISKSGDKLAIQETKLLELALEELNDGNLLNNFAKNSGDKEILKSWFLLTDKPMIYVCNVSDDDLVDINANQFYKKIQNYADLKKIHCIPLCGNIEMEISKIMDSNDKKEFFEMYDLEEPGLNKLIFLAYKQLGLITFFTAGPKEIRAWTIGQNTLAPQAAGAIHSDFERGFIKAEIYHFSDLVKYKSEISLKGNGKIRQEGKEYLVVDGDVIFFRFNV